MSTLPRVLNGAKNCKNSYIDIFCKRSYIIKVMHKDEIIGYLNGVQNMDDGTTCLKLVTLNESIKLMKRFLDTRSAYCSIAGTKRMLKKCTCIYYFHLDMLYTLRELGYNLDDITMSLYEVVNE